MPFQIRGLEAGHFSHLFSLDERELAAIGAHRVIADKEDAYPCRVSLTRVAVGEELLLLNHVHQATPTSPYRASGPIFASRASKAGVYRDELAPILKDRLLSLRAYDADALIVDAAVGENGQVLDVIQRFFSNPKIVHIDAHFAGRGCFGARIERV
ncbi:DUF1203 domain-containing protein [Microvirga sp. 2YAF29]|uniref:DUF1203 domain-containing protein n=1 Tax=Microvirga sp. 2YAF29 TaxID=3233031 RepID=UPI003F96663B